VLREVASAAGLHDLFAHVKPHNTRSIAVFERNGFFRDVVHVEKGSPRLVFGRRLSQP
jgi:RimJ/RimL family protein N-acetyltransferase